MESTDPSGRKSGILSIINRKNTERINTEISYTSASSMAAAAVVSPGSMYSNGPPPPYSSGWPGPTSHASSGLISPPDSRRTSDNRSEPPTLQVQTAPLQRQSLPSIHEALSSGPKPNPYASPISASLPPSHQQVSYSQAQTPSMPLSYASSDHSTYPSQMAPLQQHRTSPPQPIHPTAFPRIESASNHFPENSRHPSLNSLQPAPPPPHNPYAAPRYDPTRIKQDSRAPEMSNGHAYPPPPPQQTSYPYGPNSQVPQSLRGSTFNQPRYPVRDMREPGDAWKSREQRSTAPAFKDGLKRHLDVWDFENSLAQINVSSNALLEWSSHYNTIAQEQQRSVNVIPDRMPSMQSCVEMLEHQNRILTHLSRMKDIIEQEDAMAADQRMREQGAIMGGDYDDEISMYGDMKNQGFSGSDGKKRRGRAAPPGRCHSCNRAETPEWRRGPDGARTLCNACGLHFAKLTRKNTMKQTQSSNGSSLRPKSIDDHSPRPI